jgi:hypothetical protein
MVTAAGSSAELSTIVCMMKSPVFSRNALVITRKSRSDRKNRIALAQNDDPSTLFDRNADEFIADIIKEDRVLYKISTGMFDFVFVVVLGESLALSARRKEAGIRSSQMKNTNLTSSTNFPERQRRVKKPGLTTLEPNNPLFVESEISLIGRIDLTKGISFAVSKIALSVA